MSSSEKQTIDGERLQSAYDKMSRLLLDRKNSKGFWIGTLSESALSTASAVSALSVFRNSLRIGHHQGRQHYRSVPGNEKKVQHHFTDEEIQTIDTLIQKGVTWLVNHQNTDGGWGDTDQSISNVSTTFLVKSALILSDVYLNTKESANPQRPSHWHDSGIIGWSMDILRKTDAYLRSAGGIEAVRRRYGKDQTFSVPILTNAALAGLIMWKDVPQLPFERAAFPMALFRFLRLHVVSYAIPALVAIGQVRFHYLPEKNKPVISFFRRIVRKRTLKLIQKMQPKSGGYLEAAPLTSFVVMSIAAMGHLDHPIVTKGIRFLLQTVRQNGSWAIDTNLAAWLTSLSVNSLQKEDLSNRSQTLDWLLSCQHRKRHPFTGAAPGGWGWTNLSGAVPDADDTAGALLALAIELPKANVEQRRKILESAMLGLHWLLKLRNRNGGMPTFCRGWGMLPFDQSSTDITAHTIRAFQTWKRIFETEMLPIDQNIIRDINFAEDKMFRFLEQTQQPDGSWLPLWFGNQFMPNDANPFYGTAKVLLALKKTKGDETMTHNGLRYLINGQNSDGGWGRIPVVDASGQIKQGASSVEETAVVIEALSFFTDRSDVSSAYHRGMSWLLDAVESDRCSKPSPIGLYFAKLWYHEELYPIIFAVAALKNNPKRS